MSILRFSGPVKPEFIPSFNPPRYSYDIISQIGRIELSVGQNISAYPGAMAYINCPIAGFPFPVIIWEKNGRVLTDGGNAKVSTNSTTLVMRIGKEDGGDFVCTATNVAGTVRKAATVILQGTTLNSELHELSREMREDSLYHGFNLDPMLTPRGLGNHPC